MTDRDQAHLVGPLEKKFLHLGLPGEVRFGEVTFSLWAQYGGRSSSGGLHRACTVDILSFGRSGLGNGPVMVLEHAVPFAERTAGKFRQVKPLQN